MAGAGALDARLARLDLQGGLVAEDVVAVLAERPGSSSLAPCQSRHGAEPQVNELLALIAASEGDEAEVVVGDRRRVSHSKCRAQIAQCATGSG